MRQYSPVTSDAIVVKSEAAASNPGYDANGLLLPSMMISSDSKTPYTDATQVGLHIISKETSKTYMVTATA